MKFESLQQAYRLCSPNTLVHLTKHLIKLGWTTFKLDQYCHYSKRELNEILEKESHLDMKIDLLDDYSVSIELL